MPTIGKIRGSLPREERHQLSNIIREFRLGAGWSQENMAKAVGISAFYVATLECIPKHAEAKLNAVYVKKFKECGCDLNNIQGLTITNGHIRAKRIDADLSIKYKGEELSADLKKALVLVGKAKEEYEHRIEGLDKAIIKLEEQATSLLDEAESLRFQKDELKKKIHKAELSLDSIKASMVEEVNELPAENKPQL